MTTIRYLTADEWGMTWTRPPVAEKLLDPECYVHHVGGGAWMDQEAITVFRTLNTYAQTQKQGGGVYSALDYDVLVHYHRKSDVLTIAEGRGKWMSAATKDRNEQGEAVCVCGNFTLREPLPIEVEGTALGIVYGIERGWIARNAIIYGHKDNPAHVGATGCPGDNLYAKLPIVRSRVGMILNPAPPITPGEPVPDSSKPFLVQRNRDQAVFVTDFATYATKMVWPGDDNPNPGNDLAMVYADARALGIWNMNPTTGEFWALGEQWNEWIDALEKLSGG